MAFLPIRRMRGGRIDTRPNFCRAGPGSLHPGEAELGIVWRVIVERSVNGLDALFLQAFEMVLHFLQSLG